jgi:hypothetical protein
MATHRIPALLPAVAAERESCAKIAEGRSILHRSEGRGREAREADAITAAIRSRTDWPEVVVERKAAVGR